MARPEDVVVGNVSKKKLKVLLRLGKYMFQFRWGYLAALALSVLSNLLSLIGPKLSGRAIDAIGIRTGAVDFDAVIRYCLLMLAAYAVSSVMAYCLQIVMINLSRGIVRRMREDIFAKLMKMKVSYFHVTQTGDIISRISYDIDTINATLSTDLVQIASSVVTVVGSLVMMLSISPRLCLVFAVTVPLSILTTTKMANLFRPLFRARSGKLGELNGYAEECLSGQKTVRAYSEEPVMIERFAGRNKIAADAYFKADYYGTMVGPTVNFINNISLALVSVFGSLLFLAGGISIGDVSSFVLYSRKFSGPINESANIINELQSAAAAAERVFRLLDEAEESPDVPDAFVFGKDGPVAGQVDAEAVNFGYTPERRVIHDLTLHVKPGMTAAIVGPTGAGKTTIISLLMRFYDPDTGEIRLDGQAIAEANRSSVRRSYTMVLQDTWLFSGTIADNIAYGSPRPVSRAQIEAAARAAGIDSFIRGLPDGYDTILTDEGVNISKGQKQLLTIARAMISDAPVLILDEATSNVDSMTEMRIQSAMTDLMANRTSFVIAHRLSTVRSADVIFVLQHGRVIEQGTHDELMAAGGFYYSLHSAQFVN
ncbi:MAG: ABC transporter ATP-binding protein/permease [Clostridiales bacterium]|nr:ABC transporter ATP-binding protein/permease [Clostridiales bacterium]